MDLGINDIQRVIEAFELDLVVKAKDSQLLVAWPPLLQMPARSRIDWCLISDRPNTLYIHIPFCTGICTYCNYVTKSISSNNPEIDLYLDILDREAKLLRAAMGGQQISVKTIYIGGGTPTILSGAQLQRLFSTVKTNFNLSDCIEFTLEGCPETMTTDRLLMAQDHGVTRISIGVETFDDEILRSVNRRHNSKQAMACIDTIRSSGFNHFDIDIINNLPGSTVDSVAHDCKIIEQLDTVSVTLYHYHMKPRSVDNKKHRLRDQREMKISQIQKHQVFRRILGIRYQEYMCDWFSLDNLRFQHQLIKWNVPSNQLTLGQGCYGLYQETQFRMQTSFEAYRDMIMHDQLPVQQAYTTTPTDQCVRERIFALRLLRPFRCDGHPALQLVMEKFCAMGLTQITANGWLVTDLGRYFLDEIQRSLGGQSLASVPDHI